MFAHRRSREAGRFGEIAARRGPMVKSWTKWSLFGSAGARNTKAMSCCAFRRVRPARAPCPSGDGRGRLLLILEPTPVTPPGDYERRTIRRFVWRLAPTLRRTRHLVASDATEARTPSPTSAGNRALPDLHASHPRSSIHHAVGARTAAGRGSAGPRGHQFFNAGQRWQWANVVDSCPCAKTGTRPCVPSALEKLANGRLPYSASSPKEPVGTLVGALPRRRIGSHTTPLPLGGPRALATS